MRWPWPHDQPSAISTCDPAVNSMAFSPSIRTLALGRLQLQISDQITFGLLLSTRFVSNHTHSLSRVIEHLCGCSMTASDVSVLINGDSATRFVTVSYLFRCSPKSNPFLERRRLRRIKPHSLSPVSLNLLRRIPACTGGSARACLAGSESTKLVRATL